MDVGEGKKAKEPVRKRGKTKRDSLLQRRHWQHAKSCCSPLTLEHTHEWCGRERIANSSFFSSSVHYACFPWHIGGQRI